MDRLHRLARGRRLALVAGGAALLAIVIAVATAFALMGGDSDETEARGEPSAEASPADGRATASSTRRRTSTPRVTSTPGDATATPAPGETPAQPSGGQPPTGGEPPAAGQPPPGGGQPPPPPGANPTATPRPRPTDTPAPLGITIVSPADGASVPATFTVQVAITGIQLGVGPGGQLIPGRGHWHIAIDRQPPLPETIGTPSKQIGPLPAGTHTITAFLNLNDADLTVVAVHQVTVTVR